LLTEEPRDSFWWGDRHSIELPDTSAPGPAGETTQCPTDGRVDSFRSSKAAKPRRAPARAAAAAAGPATAPPCRDVAVLQAGGAAVILRQGGRRVQQQQGDWQ
jgi:hypothetical protein